MYTSYSTVKFGETFTQTFVQVYDSTSVLGARYNENTWKTSALVVKFISKLILIWLLIARNSINVDYADRWPSPRNQTCIYFN